MESKNLTKKLNSLYWGIIYALPLILTLASVLGLILSNQQTGAPLWTNYTQLFDNTTNIFSNFVMPQLRSTFVNLFSTLSGNSSTLVYYCSALFGWFVQLQLIHLIVDIITWIIRLAQKYVE